MYQLNSCVTLRSAEGYWNIYNSKISNVCTKQCMCTAMRFLARSVAALFTYCSTYMNWSKTIRSELRNIVWIKGYGILLVFHSVLSEIHRNKKRKSTFILMCLPFRNWIEVGFSKYYTYHDSQESVTTEFKTRVRNRIVTSLNKISSSMHRRTRQNKLK